MAGCASEVTGKGEKVRGHHVNRERKNNEQVWGGGNVILGDRHNDDIFGFE